MSGNTIGRLFTVTTFGESHGPALGCIVDGCPPGLELSEADLQRDVDRRRTGTSQFVSQRREGDQVRILSGVFEGRTTGTPIGLLDREHRRALARLREDQGPLPPRSRRLHLSAEVRLSRLSRRRPLVGARDRHARRRRRHRAQVSRRAARRAHQRLPEPDRRAAARCRWRPQTAYDNPFFCPDPARVDGARGAHVEDSRARATRSARASPSSRPACRPAWASRCSTGSMPTSRTR